MRKMRIVNVTSIATNGEFVESLEKYWEGGCDGTEWNRGKQGRREGGREGENSESERG